MATNYPAGLDVFANPTGSSPLSSPPHHSQHADVNDAVEAIEAELGLVPSGSEATVAARLDGIESVASSHDHAFGGGAQIDHGLLAGLADDDHTQYLNLSRHAAVDAADHGSGSAPDGHVLTADGSGGAAWAAQQGGDVVYADGGDTLAIDIASTNPVTLRSVGVPNVAVGDVIVAELVGRVSNNAGADRSYTLSPDFDGAFAPTHQVAGVPTGKDAVIRLTFQMSVQSTTSASLSWEGKHGIMTTQGVAVAATTLIGHDTTGSDLTGTVTVSVTIKSSNATGIQRFDMSSFVIRHLT